MTDEGAMVDMELIAIGVRAVMAEMGVTVTTEAVMAELQAGVDRGLEDRDKMGDEFNEETNLLSVLHGYANRP